MTWQRWLVVVAVATCYPAIADAQVRPAPRAQPRPAPMEALSVRGFGDFGGVTFSSSDTFEAVLGTPGGTVFGGGGEVVFYGRIFAAVRASRFQKTGERVFIVDGETFGLGIDDTIRITPIEATGGVRFPTGRLVPYAGAGVGWHRLQETSDFADDSENVDETHVGFHVLGGAEFRLARWFGVGGELQWTTVPDAIGQDPNSASAAFGETDLGGVAFRVKFVVGR